MINIYPQFYLPSHPSLACSIDRIWFWESAGEEVPLLPTLAPGAGAEVFFHYRAPFSAVNRHGEVAKLPQAYMLALREQPLQQIATSPVGFIAVRFKTGMLRRFIELSGADLLEGIWSVEDLWGAAGRELMEQIVMAGDNASRSRRLEAFLLRRQLDNSSDNLMEYAAQSLYYTQGELQIGNLATKLNVSQRQLERRFKEASGVTPSTMRRLGRLQKSMRTLMLTPDHSMLDTLLKHGYYDQSHFHRDFRALIGESPVTFLTTARARPHFYLPSKVYGKVPFGN